MAKKAQAPTLERGAKTKAVKEYLSAHRKARPKDVVAALKEQGIDVLPNMVSIIKAKSKVRKAKRQATEANGGQPAGSTIRPRDKAAGLDAALLLYKAAASSQDVSGGKVRQAFLSLVELLG